MDISTNHKDILLNFKDFFRKNYYTFKSKNFMMNQHILKDFQIL